MGRGMAISSWVWYDEIADEKRKTGPGGAGRSQAMEEIQRAAILGLGALGILFGIPMEEHSQLQVIADQERIRRYQAQPGRCNGKPYSFRYCLPQEGKPVDLILVSTKTTALEGALPELKNFVGPDTVILSLLNGITSEEKIEAAYPGHTLWSVAIGMDATRTGRDLEYKNMGMIQFGEKSGEMTPRLDRVKEYFHRCGIPCQVCRDILYKQWHKLMVNVGLNQTSAAFGLTYGGLCQKGKAYDTMLQAMGETIALANAKGVPLPRDNHIRWLEANLPTFKKDGRPSMGQDILAGRTTEVEEFSGIVRRMAKEYGIPTPANDFFYDTIRKLEGKGACQ